MSSRSSTATSRMEEGLSGIRQQDVAEAREVETAVLVGLITPEQNERKTREYLDELEFLASTAGAVTGYL